MTQFVPQVSYDKLVLLGDSSNFNVDIATNSNSNNNTNIDTNINNNNNIDINSNTNIIPLTFVYKSPPVLVPNIR